MIKGIIFDMDGVLVDTEWFYQVRRERFLDLMGFSGHRGINFIGSNERAIWETLIPDDEEFRQEMLMGYRAYRRLHPTDYVKLVNPHMKQLFKELHNRGIKIAIASSSDLKAIYTMTESAGVQSWVDYIISGEQCMEHKPKPEIYIKALAGLGLTTQEVIAVEDSPTGIQSALAAGLSCYALQNPHGQKMDQSTSTGIIKQLTDVLDLVKMQNK